MPTAQSSSTPGRDKGIAATDIAKMLGVSRATVYRYCPTARRSDEPATNFLPGGFRADRGALVLTGPASRARSLRRFWPRTLKVTLKLTDNIRGGADQGLMGKPTVCSRRSANAAGLRRVAIVLHSLKAILEAGTGTSAVTQKGGGMLTPLGGRYFPGVTVIFPDGRGGGL
jgi:Helix-turn-helix domain of resolvase